MDKYRDRFLKKEINKDEAEENREKAGDIYLSIYI